MVITTIWRSSKNTGGKERMNNHQFTEEELNIAKITVKTEDLANIALSALGRMTQPVCMVSGPITSGGFNDLEKNLEVFGKTIIALQGEGKNIFSQLPFEDAMVRIWKEWKEEGYCMPLLTKIYAPILESRFVKIMYFIPGWEKSFGASWEYKKCAKLGIARVLLSQEFINKLLAA